MQNLLPASLYELATARTAYRLQVAGNALAPSIKHGDLVTITPDYNAKPETIKAGTVVLAAHASNPALPAFFDRPALFTLTADGSLIAGTLTVKRGEFAVLGIVQEAEKPAPMVREATAAREWACIS